MSEMVPTASLRGISKRYGGSLALDSIDLDLMPGEIHALLGENGAGKSTLAKILSGATSADSGELRLEGELVAFETPADSARAGIAMVYQETSLVDSMTVAQNLFLGDEKFLNRLSPLNIHARELLESHNFHIEPAATVGSLGAAQKQMVEIARASHRDSKLIIFDEPTASLTPEEKQQLFLTMNRLKRAGVAVLFITHNLEEALEQADKATILRDGTLQTTSGIAELDRASIVRMMVGRDVEYSRRPGTIEPGSEAALVIDNLTVGGMVQNMSFSVYPGQIVGLAGLVGAGRTETALVAFGAMKRRRLKGGTVTLNGKRVRYRTPRTALRDGIAYVTEDRKASGIFPHLSIADNIHLGYLASSPKLPPLATARGRQEVAGRFVERFRIRALEPDKAKLEELSGGNQQKVVLAKALTHDPSVVIFDEPTRGVDVGAIEEIHALIREIAERGIAVVVISSYLPEILALSDRILVARGGRVVAEFDAEEATQEAIMFAAVH